MPINIRGKEYFTVAERINTLHTEKADQYEVLTDIHTFSPPLVIVRATVRIHTANGPREYNGHAYEMMDQGQINSTSALENCETSAIGRALAAAGYGGTEYASANEVENAIHKQENGKTEATTTANKPNKYKGSCGRCGQEVAAEAGYSQKVGDKWLVFHHDCPTPVTPEPTPEPTPDAKPAPAKAPTAVGATKGTTVTQGSEMYPCSPAQYGFLLACLKRTDLSRELIEQAAFLVDNPTINLNNADQQQFGEKGYDVVMVPNKLEANNLITAVKAHLAAPKHEQTEDDDLPF